MIVKLDNKFAQKCTLYSVNMEIVGKALRILICSKLFNSYSLKVINKLLFLYDLQKGISFSPIIDANEILEINYSYSSDE